MLRIFYLRFTLRCNVKLRPLETHTPNSRCVILRENPLSYPAKVPLARRHKSLYWRLDAFLSLFSTNFLTILTKSLLTIGLAGVDSGGIWSSGFQGTGLSHSESLEPTISAPQQDLRNEYINLYTH